jgi:hypothetical protein
MMTRCEERSNPVAQLVVYPIVVHFVEEPLMGNLIKGFGKVKDNDICLAVIVEGGCKVMDCHEELGQGAK